jgi:hypothetical protein
MFHPADLIFRRLNTFLELKVENERLQEKLADLRLPKTRTMPQYGRSNRPEISLRRPSQPQNAYGARPTLSPLATSHPSTGYAQSSAASATTPYPVSVSMPMELSALSSASGLAGYTYPPQVNAPAAPAPYYSLEQQAEANRPRNTSFSNNPSGYGDYGQMLPPSTPTDRYSSYANALGMSGSIQPPPVIDDRRDSISGMSMDLRVAIGRRGSDAVYAGAAPIANGNSTGAVGAGATSERVGDDEDERGKKKKRRHAPDQFVCRTCGRTDSPEWRKGPDGPKTLCNACGLRWAKQVRKGDDAPKDGAEGE